MVKLERLYNHLGAKRMFMKLRSALQVPVSVWELMGIRMEGLLPAAMLPLLLTTVQHNQHVSDIIKQGCQT